MEVLSNRNHNFWRICKIVELHFTAVVISYFISKLYECFLKKSDACGSVLVCLVMLYCQQHPGPQREIFPGVRRSTPGPQNLVKHLQINQKRSSLKFVPIFCPKLGEEQKKNKKKGLHSNLVPFFAQNQVKNKKKSSPKIRWRAKKRSSLKFGPIFCPKLGEEQKEEKKLVQNLTWTTSTFPGPLSPSPGNGSLVQNLTRQPHDVPPSRRPWQHQPIFVRNAAIKNELKLTLLLTSKYTVLKALFASNLGTNREQFQF